MLKPFVHYRLGKSPVLILEKTAIFATYGYRRYNEKIKHLATKCWLGASFAKFTLYVNSDGGDEEDRTLYLLNAIQALSQVSYAPKFSAESSAEIIITQFFCSGNSFFKNYSVLTSLPMMMNLWFAPIPLK